MPKNSTDHQIRSRIEAFVDEISELIRMAALGSVHAALAGKIGFTPLTLPRGRPRKAVKAAKRGKAPRSKSGKRVRRSSESVHELAAKVQAAVRSGPGRRLGEIAKQLGMDAKEIRRPAQVLVAERKLKTTGRRGGTRYFPGGRGSASSKSRKASKKKSTKRAARRKTRKGASRKPTTKASVATPAAA